MPTLKLVFSTLASETITRSALQQFCAKALEQDDITQPAFFLNIAFYGCREKDLCFHPDALEELASWDVKTRTIIEGDLATYLAPGPYVSGKWRT